MLVLSRMNYLAVKMFVDMRFGADFSSVASSYLRILVLNIGLMWSWVFVFRFLIYENSPTRHTMPK